MPKTAINRRPRTGWKRIFTSSNHQDIGTLYLVFAIFAGILSGVISVLMRSELATPGIQIFSGLVPMVYGASADRAADHGREMYQVFVTAHGLLMIFFVVSPAMIGGFGNWFVPLMIGAPDMAFPRLNQITFWLLPLALLLLIGSSLAAPHSGPALTYVLGSLLIAGLSIILLAINFITTILNMREPQVNMMAMPVFVWSILISSFMLLLSLPIFAGALTMLQSGTETSSSLLKVRTLLHGGAGDRAVDYQQLLWFFAHPELYILILPGFGIVSEVVSCFSQRQIVGYRWLIYTLMAIGLIGFIVWAQHIFAIGQMISPRRYFAIASLVIALPSGLLVALWLATLKRGKISWRVPLLWALGFIFLFAIGSLNGVIVVWAGHETAGSQMPGNLQTGMTHFHYLISLSVVFAIFAGWYYWFPKMTGYLYAEGIAKLQFWISFIGVNLLALPQFLLISPEDLANWNMIASWGAYLAAGGTLIFLGGMAQAFYAKRPAGQNPWGKGAISREWTVAPASSYNE